MTPAPTPIDDSTLAQASRIADPLADDALDAVLRPWDVAEAENLQRLAAVNRAIATWQCNADLVDWRAPQGTPPEVADALAAFVQSARHLPDWADAAQIDSTERQFMEQGVLSCILLFCASLPECYVLPDLADVLHATGQLEQRADYRIRSTAAMIFPVMMSGGLTSADGSGIAQVLKVRLIHAMVRHLVLHGAPAQALQREAVVPASRTRDARPTMERALLAHGWNVGTGGLPCNQQELAYTLLTFGYVFVRGMRTLGLGLSTPEEQACLHTWNVVGHLLGIRPELMVHRVAQAEVLFGQLQAIGRARATPLDPRPALAEALMQTMSGVIPWRTLKPVPVLLTRLMCGHATNADLGLNRSVSWVSRGLFTIGLWLVRVIDAGARTVVPRFSLSRLFTRVVGYRVLTRLLMSQTRPLKLPDQLLRRAQAVSAGWGSDPHAPDWINRLEDRMTEAGDWTAR